LSCIGLLLFLGESLKTHFLHLILIMCLGATSTTAMALTDTYFATGEDLDYIIESDSTTPLLEFEYRLRRFIIFRKIEDYFLDIYFSDDFIDD